MTQHPAILVFSILLKVVLPILDLSLLISHQLSDYIGALAGYVYYGHISYCYASDISIAADTQGWRFTGDAAPYGTVTDCYTAGIISGSDHIGGFAGYNYYGTNFKLLFKLPGNRREQFGRFLGHKVWRYII